jgi:hypothetical protein
MRLLQNNFRPNGLVQDPHKTMSDQLINFPSQVNTDYLGDVDYIRPLLSYGEPWNINSDLFQYLHDESLNKLRNEKCILVFDASMEGFSPCELPLAMSLHQQCLKYNIDPRKIYLLTANFKDSVCYNNYLAIQRYQTGINIVETTAIGDMVLPNRFETFEEHVDLCKLHHSDKIFLQLSRRNRPYRVLANYLMDHSSARHYALLSQDKLEEPDISKILHEYYKSPTAGDELTRREIREWNLKNLPMIADNTDFQINWANWRSPELYNRTLFSVVLETSQQDYGGTSMFFSEKFFKPIVHRQPFIVFGHRGINSFMRNLGFRTYEQWFDFSEVDEEVDPVHRLKKIIKIVEYTVDYLKKMSVQDRVKWRFMNSEVLNFNYELFVRHVLRHRESTRMHTTIKSLFDGRFYNHMSGNPSYQ